VIRAVVVAALLVAGCASMPECPAGERTVVSEVLYFGTARPQGVVSAAEWSDFLRDEVTPRFPSGFSVWDAAGQWRSAAGTIDREASHVISVVHNGDARYDEGVRAVIAGTIAGLYVLGAGWLAMAESSGQGCMGFCFGLATFPEFLLLGLLPDRFFYTPLWTGLLMYLFGIAAIAFNALVLFTIIGGAWWRREARPGS
jgi:hypothetical protein